MIEIIPNWHPLFVHFTVALLSISVSLFMLAWVLKEHRWRTQWLHAAHWNLWLGAGFAVATVTAGWFAFNSVVHDPPIPCGHDRSPELGLLHVSRGFSPYPLVAAAISKRI